jgi:ClpX C4-type zinc finger protein
VNEKKPPEVLLAERELLDATNQLRAMRGEPPLSELPTPPYCSFCGRAKSECGALVEGEMTAGDNAYICQRCVAEAHRRFLEG